MEREIAETGVNNYCLEEEVSSSSDESASMSEDDQDDRSEDDQSEENQSEVTPVVEMVPVRLLLNRSNSRWPPSRQWT